MGQALYRKYRSESFDEVIGQDHIVTVLKNSLKDSNVSHAYLFTGPRGVGKTSVARILARNVNGLKPDDKGFYPDIVEIDAASNRRIDEVRDLREKVVIAPSSLKFKVYIIDEVHMLTREAFNALLKTLEEPPEHAIFILATTDYHKVPDTIVSRCIRLSFKPISIPDTVDHLKSICKLEKISADDDALELIAKHSSGSFRDALSILDQLSSLKRSIDTELVESVLGIPSAQALEQIINSAKSGKIDEVMSSLGAIFNEGSTASKIISELSSLVRESLSKKTDLLTTASAIDLIEDLTTAYTYQDQRLGLEMALLKLARQNAPKDNVPAKPVQAPAKKVKDEPLFVVKQEVPAQKPAPKSKSNNINQWEQVLSKLKKDNSSLYAVARMAEVSLEGSELNLVFKFGFHYKQMSLDKNKIIIMNILNDLNSDIQTINTSLDNNSADASAKSENTNDISSLSNIFGSVEVLES